MTFASRDQLQQCILCSVSLELLQGSARIAFLRNMALLAINMRATWRGSSVKSPEQVN